MSWERQKRQMEKMSPEELAAFKERRAVQQRATYNARMARERAAGIRPPAVKGRPRPTKAQLAAAKAAEEETKARAAAEKAALSAQRRLEREERKRARRREGAPEVLNAFIAQGAPTKGFSAFLRSQEIAKADQLNKPKVEAAA